MLIKIIIPFCQRLIYFWKHLRGKFPSSYFAPLGTVPYPENLSAISSKNSQPYFLSTTGRYISYTIFMTGNHTRTSCTTLSIIAQLVNRLFKRFFRGGFEKSRPAITIRWIVYGSHFKATSIENGEGMVGYREELFRSRYVSQRYRIVLPC